MITEDQRQIDKKAQNEFNYRIFEEKDVWTWNIFNKARAASPILARYFDLIEKLISVGTIGNEDLDRFYKTKDSESKSIEIVKSKSISALVGKAENCKLKKRVIANTRVKAEYVKEGNFNFFKSEYSEDAGKLVFTALNRSQMEKNIAKRKLAVIAGCVDRSGTIMSALESVDEQKDFDRDTFLYSFYYMGEALQKLFTKDTSGKGYKFWQSAKNMENVLRTAHPFYTPKTEKSILNEAIIISSAFDLYEVSLNQSISKTFDMVDRDRISVELNTKIEKIESVNPVSGFVSIRNTRIKSEIAQLSDSEIEKVVKDFSETNKFFEDLSALIRIEEDRVNSKSKASVKLVSGDEIVALYNVSSYKGTAALDNPELQYAKSGEKEGTLFNSCMRGASVKNRIKFYAENDHFIKMLALTTGDGKYLMGRAVVWYEKSTEKHYVDRMFTNCDASAEKMITFVNENENFFFINSSGVSKSIMKSGKLLSNFLIEFNGVKSTNQNPPYFDTMSTSLYVKNNKLFIGRPEDSKTMETIMKKDVLYYTSKSFNRIPLVIKKDLTKGDEEICQVCRKIIKDSAFKFGENYICANHITIASDGEILAENQGNVYTLGDNQAQKTYIANILTCSNIRHFKPEATTKIERKNSHFQGAGACTIIIDATTKRQSKYYEGLKVDIKAVPLQKEKKIEQGNSFLFKNAREENDFVEFGNYYSLKDTENLYFDPKTIKMINVEPITLAIPANPTDSQLEITKECLKHVAILKCDSSNYKILEEKKEFVKELTKLMKSSESLKDNPINLDQSLSISDASRNWSGEFGYGKIKAVEVDGEIKRMKFMSTQRFANYGELKAWPLNIPVNCIDISNTKAEQEYERLLKMIA